MAIQRNRAEATVEELFTLFRSSGHAGYSSERVSQLEHALQCASQARDEGRDDETVIAALLHDSGHLCAPPRAPRMGSAGVSHHETIGAVDLRKRRFSSRVTELVSGHVQAKRYLTFKGPGYFEELSPVSVQTLGYQGGPMSADEAAEFESDPLSELKLRVRLWDERGKRPGWAVPPLETYRDLLVQHLDRHAQLAGVH